MTAVATDPRPKPIRRLLIANRGEIAVCSLLAKIVVTGCDRGQALTRARRALCEFRVSGQASTVPFHRWLLDQEAFRTGATSIVWAEQAWTQKAAV